MICVLPAGRVFLRAAATPLLVLYHHCPPMCDGDHAELPCGLEGVMEWSGQVPKSALPSQRSRLSQEGGAAVTDGGSHVLAGRWS